MHDSSGEQYDAAAVIGGGLIGSSWTALFLAQVLRVTVHDPRPDIEPVVRAGLRAVAPTLQELGMDVAGLVVAGAYPTPVGHAHIVTFTTHKSLCGPRGACIL